MGELRYGAELSLDFFESGYVLRREFDWVVAFVICNQIVQLRRELGRVREILGVEVYQAEERLHLADLTRRGPLAEHSEILGIGETPAVEITCPR